MFPSKNGAALLASLGDQDSIEIDVSLADHKPFAATVVGTDGRRRAVDPRTSNGLANQYFLRFRGRENGDGFYRLRYVVSPKGRAWMAARATGEPTS